MLLGKTKGIKQKMKVSNIYYEILFVVLGIVFH